MPLIFFYTLKKFKYDMHYNLLIILFYASITIIRDITIAIMITINTTVTIIITINTFTVIIFIIVVQDDVVVIVAIIFIIIGVVLYCYSYCIILEMK